MSIPEQAPDGSSYEAKPSKHRQWNEHTSAPIINKPVSLEEIEYFKNILAKSYKSMPKDVTWKFVKINDIYDEDKDDFMSLEYYLDCVVDSKPINRKIYTRKVPIPEEIKQKLEQSRKLRMEKTTGNIKKIRKALPAPEGITITEVTEPVNTTNTRSRPKRPVRSISRK